MKPSSQLKLKPIISEFLDWDKFSVGKITDDDKALEALRKLYQDIKDGKVSVYVMSNMLIEDLKFRADVPDVEKMHFIETMTDLLLSQCEAAYQLEYSARFNSPV